MTVLIAGGGIAGLSLALTCHQVGVPVRVFELAEAIKPLGVGINLQPNAVRELIDLGLQPALDEIGIKTQHVGLYSKKGRLIWREPRGLAAGYRWPQYSLHRGQLQMLLYETVIERLGAAAVRTGATVKQYRNTADGVEILLEDKAGTVTKETGRLLVAADGVHSAVRAQMVPGEGPPIWSGAILWRSTSRAEPFGDGATMAMIGHATQRFVTYPISPADPDTGLATVNWIAELSFDPKSGFNREDYARAVDVAEFLPSFADWRYDWLDTNALIGGADKVFEYPMVDRDPLPGWNDGNVTLMGDAAHVTYPVGSNGASQAIVDARKIGRAFLDHGVNARALDAYEAEMLPAMATMIETNRSRGPDHILQIIEDRCGGEFDDIETVMPRAEMAAFAAKYKAAAGLGIDALNAQEAIIPAGARV